MSDSQKAQLSVVLGVLRKNFEHFGYGTHDAAELKSDLYAAQLADALGYELVPFNAARGDELKRDRRQVAWSHILIAAPKTNEEMLRSGTWATVRYARKRHIPVIHLSR